jgi:methionine-rich copper-binding protein CopC
MRRVGWLGAALLTVCAAGAEAHAHLLSAVPADNSSLSTSPAQLVLRFSESARLTALWISKDGAPKQKLAAPDASQPQLTVPLPPLAPGHYLVSWRALSADGHVVSGQIRFTLTR